MRRIRPGKGIENVSGINVMNRREIREKDRFLRYYSAIFLFSCILKI